MHNVNGSQHNFMISEKDGETGADKFIKVGSNLKSFDKPCTG